MPTAVTVEVEQEDADPAKLEFEKEQEDDDVMKLMYKEMSGVADATESGYESAIGAYNLFAERQKYPRFQSVTQKMLCGGSKEMPHSIVSILSQFCSFLLDYKIEKEGKRKGKHYMPGSAAQYLSGVKTVWKKKFPRMRFWATGDPVYNDLYKRLKIRARVQAIKRGDSPADSTEGLHYDELVAANDVLLGEERYADRAVLNAQYHAVGRSSEIGTWSWAATAWNPRQQQLESDWRETKTSKNGLMTWHCDARSYLTDMYHSLAAYIATADGKFDIAKGSSPFGEAASMVFPEFYDLASGGAAAKVSRIIESLRGKVDGITENHTGHSLRVGAADDMVYHRFFNLVDAIARGNWDFAGDCNIFDYFMLKLFVGRAGKVLSGWMDPAQEVYCPSLDSIVTTENAQSFKNWMTSLFSTVGIPELESKGTLRNFRAVMLASLLKDHKNMVDRYGYQNRLVRRLIDSSRIYGYTPEMLIEWSEKVTADWESKNASNFRRSDFTSQNEKQTILLQEVAKKVNNMDKNMATKEDVAEVKDSLERLNRKLDSILGFYESPRKKQRRSERDESCRVVDATAVPSEPVTEKQAAVANAFAVMGAAAAAKPLNPFKDDAHLRKTPLKILLLTIVESRINWRNPEGHIFGKGIGKQLKAKVLKLLHAVHDAGTAGALVPKACFGTTQLPYLLGTNVPADKQSEHYGKWLEHAAGVYASVQKKFMFYLATEWNEVADLHKALQVPVKKKMTKKSYDSKGHGNVKGGKGSTKLDSNVGSLVSVVENLKGFKNEVKAANGSVFSIQS